ncbi:MAG: hypothetical protein B6I20_05825 [Bacteroidetes bacterium 4572_117]|nr:MAG: hypothetical protein B6I20_05825 [Bacteroidetes bacterium 4572_117]
MHLYDKKYVFEYSNNKIELVFFVNPEFAGGNVKLEVPILYAKNISKAQHQLWDDITFRQPRKLIIDNFIDASKIADVSPPIIKIISPNVRGVIPTDNQTEIPYIQNKSMEVIVDVWDNGGLSSVKINERPASKYPNGKYFDFITLFTGENTIKIVATDKSGNTSIEKFKVICTYQYDIDVSKGKYYALLIGIDDYLNDGISDLKGPIEDAKKLKEILNLQYTFDKENITVLENPKRSDLISSFENIAEKITEDDNLLIFYAGHGLWNEKIQTGYWLPSDASYKSTSNWFRNSTVKDFINSIKSKHTLLISDACFSGSIFRTRSVVGKNITAYNKLYSLNSRKGMTSGTLKEVPDKSVFIEQLIINLSQNNEKFLPSAKLFNNLRDAVLNNSPNVPQYGTIQGVGDNGGEFIFIKR